MLYLPAATKLGQGNVFTGVCDSVNGGGVCLSACWDTTPTAPRTRPPRADTTLPGADPPGADPLHGPDTPQTRHPPEQTPPRPDTPPPGRDPTWTRPPPGKQTPGYGQRAAGTHPTGMHSCILNMQ